MSLTIHGTPKSRAFRVYWLCEELAIPYTAVPTSYETSAGDPTHLAINPNGRIPAIDDGGFRLFESFAITSYLARRHGRPPFVTRPDDLQAEALTWQWTLWAVNELEKQLIDLARHRIVLPEAQRQPALADAAEAAIQRPLAVLQQHLAGRPQLLGDDFTLADLHVAATMYPSWFFGIDYRPWPAVLAWLERALERPAAGVARRMREG